MSEKARRVSPQGHGTRVNYDHFGCRCEPCKQAFAAHTKRKRDQNAATVTLDDPRHGTDYFYVSFRCRCAPCKEAHRVVLEGARKERYKAAKGPDDPRHGRPSFYSNHGCRCFLCREAWAARCKAYSDAKKGGAT